MAERPPKNHVVVPVTVLPEIRERWRNCARARGLPLRTWLRQVANEECERQAALILYQIRVERPHELNAILEETLRQAAVANCPDRRLHEAGQECDTCHLVPYQPMTATAPTHKSEPTTDE